MTDTIISSSILALSDIDGISLNVGLKERTERITDFTKSRHLMGVSDASMKCDY